MDNIMLYIWIGAAVVFLLLEAATTALVSVWLVAGSLAAAITSVYTDSVAIQFVVFLVVTCIALIVTRPIYKKISKKNNKISTNTDRFVGETGVVTQTINNMLGQGQIVVLGKVWTARAKDNSIIPEEEKVVVESIEGVKLIVLPVHK